MSDAAENLQDPVAKAPQEAPKDPLAAEFAAYATAREGLAQAKTTARERLNGMIDARKQALLKRIEPLTNLAAKAAEMGSKLVEAGMNRLAEHLFKEEIEPAKETLAEKQGALVSKLGALQAEAQRRAAEAKAQQDREQAEADAAAFKQQIQDMKDAVGRFAGEVWSAVQDDFNKAAGKRADLGRQLTNGVNVIRLKNIDRAESKLAGKREKIQEKLGTLEAVAA